MQKKGLLAIFLILILSLSLVMAAEGDDGTTDDDLEDTPEEVIEDDVPEGFSEQAAYSWLLDQGVDGNYGDDIVTTALVGLAFNQVGYDASAQQAADWIMSQLDDRNCFPNKDCKIKDTSIALLLLNDLGMETDNIQKWLEESQTVSNMPGNWLLEISTSATGTCSINYALTETPVSDSIEVNKGKFPAAGNSYFLNLDVDYKPGLVTASPGLEFTVDCGELGDTPITTLLYNKDNTYFIINTGFSSMTEITLPNGCYGRVARGPCNPETSLYATWALTSLGSAKNVNFYLTDNYKQTDIPYNSLSYVGRQANEKYLEALVSRQIPDGSFERDFFKTALSLLALQDSFDYSENVGEAKIWLQEKQSEDGSWNQNMRDTAMILYSAFGNAVLQPEVIKTVGLGEEVYPCDGNWICDDGESPETCTDCQTFFDEGTCNDDGYCDTFDGETADSCGDCDCGDGICDDSESEYFCSEDCAEADKPDEPDDSFDSECGDSFCDDGEICPEDCDEEKGGMGTILIIGIGVLVLLGLLLAYNKFKKPSKPKEKASPFGSRPGTKPFSFGGGAAKKAQPRQPLVRAKARPIARPAVKKKDTDSELEKSLAEARKLLKK